MSSTAGETIQRTGSLPINQLDDEKAEKEVGYRINSSTTIIEVSAVLGGFSFDRFMSCNEYQELYGKAHPTLFWWFVMSTYFAFCLNMVAVSTISIELYVTNRLLSKNPMKAVKFCRAMSGVRRIAIFSSFTSVPCLLMVVVSYAMMVFDKPESQKFVITGLSFAILGAGLFWRMQQLALKQDYSIIGGWYLRLTGQRKDKYL